MRHKDNKVNYGPVAFLKEVSTRRVVEELEEIDRACDEAMRGGNVEAVQRRVRELKLAIERCGITHA